ncbi:MAG: HD domain-containing protein, partial [Firmicutes bacterium]|nr:HD domain-containing protein [Bacillota bacterium]
MQSNRFKDVAATPAHPKWEQLTARQGKLHYRADDIRSPFARDYTRILHSKAYRRLKHKTQVFFNIENDHICTRMEHVQHVESVATTIAKFLGLNEELTKAIATGHDLGHAPFGHQGEVVLKALAKQRLGLNFWHERNSLRFVDDIELLEDEYRKHKNLGLTYAVRDGIISHCGEVDENGLVPRRDLMDLQDFDQPGKYQAATWEGCVVKISDKIAYLGRDIEDAIHLGFLEQAQREELLVMARKNDANVMNTTVIMYNMITDICKNSSPDQGIALSHTMSRQLKDIKDFNYKYIYRHPRQEPFRKYSELVITQLFDLLEACYDGAHTWDALKDKEQIYP